MPMFCKLLIACFVFLYSLTSAATEYKRGNWTCSNFESAQQEYERDRSFDTTQQGNDEYLPVYVGVNYGLCLLVKGEDNNALLILEHLVNTYSSATAAFKIANYIESGGKLDNTVEEKNVDRAIKEFYTTLYIIDKDPRYPNNGHSTYERDFQIELYSHYSVVLLHMRKFKKGLNGSHNQALLESQSYTGDKNPNLYPDDSPYTRDTVSKLIERAHTCSILPNKPYFDAYQYSWIQSACQSLEELARLIEPLEHKRLAALQSCPNITDDKESCPEYYESLSEMIDLMDKQDNRTYGNKFIWK